MSSAKKLEQKERQSSESQSDPVFTIRMGDQTHRWTYQQAFARAHLMITQKDYANAEPILKELIEVKDRGIRSHIMLAICKAGQSDYKGSRSVLDSAFQDDKTSRLAAKLHDVIVNARMGFKDDAIQELVELVNEHKEYPTLCLWLGDMLQASDRPEKAKQCFKLAIKRDRPGGAVALASQQQLRRLG
jgi:thioredoxin-like negative regulator of GroEL